MPVTTVICNPGERPVTIQECIDRHRSGVAAARGYEFPLAFTLAAIRAAKPRTEISPSAIGACPRQFVLKLSVDYTLDLEQAEAMLKGTMFHSIMEAGLADDPDYIIETPFARELEVEVDGVIHVLRLSGTPDALNHKLGIVDDYKTTGAYLRRDFQGYDQNKVQLSIYGWLARPTYPNIKRGALYYFANKQRKAIRFNLWPDAKVEAYIREQAAEYIRYYRDHKYLPAIPTDPEKLKWCNTCPVRQACAAFDDMELTHVPG